MKNKTVRQFKSVKEIEKFLGTLNNLWENVTDEFDTEDEPEVCVAEFNRALIIRSLFLNNCSDIIRTMERILRADNAAYSTMKEAAK